MENVQVSVIIPVYNTKEYVKECLNSVQNQTLKEIEILCLDDGSVDGSAQILDEIAENDSRINVIHKENSGYGKTINQGIELAKGKYISIVEPDDYIEQNMLEDLVQIADINDCDFVKADYSKFWKEKDERIFEEIYLSQNKELYQKCLSKREIELLYWGAAANPMGIYRRSFLKNNDITHNETPGASYQDEGFFFQIIMKAKSGYLSNGNYYRYRQDNPKSSIASKEKVYCICDEFSFIYKKMKKDEEQFKRYLPFYQMYRFRNYLYNVKRIAPCFRLSFLESMRKEYIGSFEKGELDVSTFYDKEQIMKNPPEFLDKFFEESINLKKAVEEYDNLIIYGAGYYGNQVYEWLKEDIKLFQHVFYAVSDIKKSPQYKNGIKVKSIYELQDYIQKAVVIVAVGDYYRNEIIEILKKLNFCNIVTLE